MPAPPGKGTAVRRNTAANSPATAAHIPTVTMRPAPQTAYEVHIGPGREGAHRPVPGRSCRRASPEAAGTGLRRLLRSRGTDARERLDRDGPPGRDLR